MTVVESMSMAIMFICLTIFVWFFALAMMGVLRVYYTMRMKLVQKQKEEHFWNIYLEDNGMGE